MKVKILFYLLALSILFLVGCEGALDIIGEITYSPIQEHVYNDFPDVAFNGNSYLVVWGNGDIFGRRISEGGDFLTPVFYMVEDETIQAQPSVVSSEDSFFVVFVDHRTRHGAVYGKYVSSAGIPEEGPGFLVESNEKAYFPYLFGGGKTLLLTVEYKERYGSDHYGIFYIVPPTEINRFPFGVRNYGRRIACFNGEKFAVINSEGVTLFDKEGNNLSSVNFNQYGEYPSINWTGDKWLLTWMQYNNEKDTVGVFFSFLSDSGLVDPPGIIHVANANHYVPLTLTDVFADHIVIFWRESKRLYKRKIDMNGNFLDSGPQLIVQRGDLLDPVNSAKGKNTILIVWREKTPPEIWGVLLDQNGDPKKGPFKISK